MGGNHSLEGKIVYGFGDSLVDGHYNGVGMLDYVTSINKMIYKKFAINGATVISCKPREIDQVSKSVYDIGTQIKMAPEAQPDYICFDGLTNDAYDEVICSKLGAISCDYDGSYDVDTFIGAFETICYLLRYKYQNSKIIYITPHKMPTRSHLAQQELIKCVVQVCQKWSIPYVDMYHGGGINTYLPGMRMEFSYNGKDETSNGNGTHLNESGYQLWYAPKIEAELLKQI